VGTSDLYVLGSNPAVEVRASHPSQKKTRRVGQPELGKATEMKILGGPPAQSEGSISSAATSRFLTAPAARFGMTRLYGLGGNVRYNKCHKRYESSALLDSDRRAL